MVLGDEHERIFMVEIAGSEYVDSLKDVIKDKNKELFQTIDALSLVLWKVSYLGGIRH